MITAAISTTTTAITVVASSLTLDHRRFAPVFRTLTSRYIKPPPIHCGYCRSYHGSYDRGFVALHMLQCHEHELDIAPIISHNQIPKWCSLEQRAEMVAELVHRRGLRAGWLATRQIK
jgi:hypothetical protein